jgi:hypothetical protein
MTFHIEIEKYHKIHMREQRPLTAKAILSERAILAVSHYLISNYTRVIIASTACIGTNRQTDQCNTILEPEINKPAHSFSSKVPETYIGGKKASSVNNHGKT